MPAPGVLVVGSLHYDIMLAAPRLPRRDETVAGSRWWPKFGGKGGNQAVAVAQAGVPCRMLGAVGEDGFAPLLRAGLQAAGVDDRFLQTIAASASGMSVAIATPDGNYGAVIVSGANLAIDPTALADAGLWDGVAVLLVQNEVTPVLNLAAAQAARARGLSVVLNAAPMRDLAPEFEALVDVLVVNAIEAEMLGAGAVSDLASAARAADWLAARFAAVVVTAGAAGLAARAAGQPGLTVAADKVAGHSSHGAGDVFTGTLAAALAKGVPLGPACQCGSTAAAAHVAGQAPLSDQPAPRLPGANTPLSPWHIYI